MKETFDPFYHGQMKSGGSGPRGGKVDEYLAHWRRSGHNGKPLDNGGLGLHRFQRNDSATVGQKDEMPWHRMAAYMLNVGRTSSEIAIAANVDIASVSHLRAQRWFQELCATIANNAGEELIGAVQSEALDSLNTIIEIRDTAESDRVRLTAAITILEHAHGKPIQKIVSDISHRVAQNPQDEMDAIQSELAAIRQAKPALAAPV